MRVLVTGDRNWTNYEIVYEEMLALHPYMDDNHTLIHGAARGADTLAARAAAELGWIIEAYPADWNQFGRAAGPIRNRIMLKSGPDIALAFHANLAKSKGTKDMVLIANKAGVPVRLFSDVVR